MMSSTSKESANMCAAEFPSLDWFQNLANLMNSNRTRQEKLGYVDCVARFTVSGQEPGKAPFSAQITFEEFEVLGVIPGNDSNAEQVDFELVGDFKDWKEMIENVAKGKGKPDMEHTLNRLSHIGTPFSLVQDDPLRKDLYFRYNQSLQEFFNASAQFQTTFG